MKMEEEKYTYIISNFLKKCRGKLKKNQKNKKYRKSSYKYMIMVIIHPVSVQIRILFEILTLFNKLA